jgi:hypothetical protein
MVGAYIEIREGRVDKAIEYLDGVIADSSEVKQFQLTAGNVAKISRTQRVHSVRTSSLLFPQVCVGQSDTCNREIPSRYIITLCNYLTSSRIKESSLQSIRRIQIGILLLDVGSERKDSCNL